MKKVCSLNVLLALAVSIASLSAMVGRALFPAAILPKWSIPTLTGISLLVLLVEDLPAAEMRRNYAGIAMLSCLTFGILPRASGLWDGGESWKLALVGGGVFTSVTWLFSSMEQRITSSGGSKLTRMMGAIGIFLASQGFSGILL